MKQVKRTLGKYTSIMYRISQTYYEERLKRFHIGFGQQFFLLCIRQNPGIGILELAQTEYFDKGTTARAVKKLEEQGYVVRETDQEDKRISRLYVTDQADPVIEATADMLESWLDLLTEGFTEEEKRQAENLMERMADNALNYVGRNKRKDREK